MSMTESEAIEKLEFLNEALSPQFPDSDECSCALQMGMDAIKEIQQYRAIGTVKVFETVIKSQMEYFNRMREYEKIGTVEEFRELKEKAMAKKVRGISLTHEGRVGNCPSCGSFVRNQEQTLYCDCGQHLDWSEGKE